MAADIKTPVGSAPVIPVALIGIGLYLTWFAIHYWDSDTRWPSDPVKAVLTGQPLPKPSGQEPAWTTAEQIVRNSPAETSIQQAVGVPPGTPSGTPGTNQQIARMLAISMGHADWTTGAQWDSWVKLWDRESGWSVTAANPSGAYGIPQALPGSKMADPAQGGGPDWKTNPTTQIRWGIVYIAQVYHSPSAAWAHEESQGWY